MAEKKDILYFLHDDIDEIFDERGNTFLSMRKVQWAKSGAEADPEKGKIELRKWMITPEGEVPNKGFSFLTEEGPHELVHMLVRNNYGNTKEILKSLATRDDFKESVTSMYEEDESSGSTGEYFDARSVLLE